MLQVLVTATSDLLVSVADVKESMDLTDAVNDTKLARFIGRASARIDAYCHRTFLLQTYRALLPAYGGERLLLPCAPVRAVLAVYDGTDTGTARQLSATEYTVDKQNGWIEYESGWPWSAQSRPEVAPFPEPNSEVARYIVDWSAGYVPLNGTTATGDGATSTGCTIPLDLQEAAISLTRSRWLSRTRDQAISSKRVGELSITYKADAVESAGLPVEVRDLLAPYRSLI
jgi:uncharacterized phiE125 gp8 family phage protein